ncbi:MAG TPA: phosphoribosylformylglycinamidine synthase subunit PurQ [Candidatus Paceibacterota bacterium]|nr:phosphoribosylformylglycinamidine synthase subunit PurQ [Candidatus Paceibacterota bacterium]
MTKPHALIFSGYGLNCEEETKAAFESVGASAAIMHINDVVAQPSVLKQAHIIALPGGFSYGDDTGAGKAYGNRLRQHLGDHLEKFLAKDTLMIGICNGFQILTSAGFLPGALVSNDSGRYLCRWVDVEVTGKTPWLSGIERLSLPIAHGEGKYVASQTMLAQLGKDDAIALKYTTGEMCEYFDLPGNPNGALENIAAVSAYDGRVLGLMPHPERAVSFFQLPHWTHLREVYARAGEAIPTEASGLQLFRNAVDYFA